MTVNRAPVVYNDASHSYALEGESLLGVSTVAKIGEAQSVWGIASAWGYRIGWRGALAVLSGEEGRPLARAYSNGDTDGIAWPEHDDLYTALKQRGLTPWATRDKAADRGNWVHDLLERLGQDQELPTSELLAGVSEEYRGHAKAVIRWYVDFRPQFKALEVQVASKHGFAGRYDCRCEIPAYRLSPLFKGHDSPQAKEVKALMEYGDVALCLVDLKTSKGVYPTSHMAQLSGYELASVEMGFPATDAQFVLNTHPDGTYDFVPSWSEAGDFLAYLGALRAIRRIEAEDPERKLKAAKEQAILAGLPALSRDLAREVPALAGMDAKGVGILLSGLRKRGLVVQDGSVWSVVPAG